MNTVVVPTPISPADAPVPVKYEAACRAISECDRIDECKDWSNKAAALATYAKQANDDSLRVMAVRIQARAYRRMGELLKQIPAGEGARGGKRQEGTLPPLTRTQAATDAGLSEHKRKTALRIASVPEREFDRQIETASPPTATQLAAQGTTQRPRSTSRPETGQELLRFAEFCAETDPSIATTMDAESAEACRRCVAIVDRWLDAFVTQLPSDGTLPSPSITLNANAGS
jgi:hypothetical protein